jgi:hypothetical protein
MSVVDLCVAIIVLTNPSGIMVKPQGALATLQLRMFVTGGPPVRTASGPARALRPHKAVRRELEEQWR